MKYIRKRWKSIILVILLFVLIVMICHCSHKSTFTRIIKQATCYDDGKIEVVCERCNTIFENKIIEKTSHSFGEYKLIIKPNANNPGTEVRVCSVCLKEETREYFCVHEVNSEEKWNYTKYATPVETGERYKHCRLCESIMSETYTIPELENNSIYITGTDIKKCFTISSFTQGAVDRYDIVYTEGSKLGSNNPFILGHNYGSLGILHQTNVGEHIYVNINGLIEIYEVIISEYGLQNSARNDIIGQTTGISIWHSYDCKTLHMYTCYGNNKNGRWMVLAKKNW